MRQPNDGGRLCYLPMSWMFSAPFLSHAVFLSANLPFPRRTPTSPAATKMFNLLVLIPLIPLARGACEQECEGVSSLLSKCSLPPFSDVWNAEAQYRNLTGLPPSYTEDDLGPETHVISTYSEAECLCVDVWKEFKDSCIKCRVRQLTFEETGQGANMISDCQAFGYYNNSLTYPSTTRPSLPSRTQASSGEFTCNDICGVLRGQIEDCDLPQLEDDRWPVRRSVPPDDDYPPRYASVLFDREDAECLCTLPVLRRLKGCRECLSFKRATGEEQDLSLRVWKYNSECSEMGYWTDWQWILPSLEDDDSPTTPVSDNSSPSPTDTEDSGRYNSVGPVLALSVIVSLLIPL